MSSEKPGPNFKKLGQAFLLGLRPGLTTKYAEKLWLKPEKQVSQVINWAQNWLKGL